MCAACSNAPPFASTNIDAACAAAGQEGPGQEGKNNKKKLEPAVIEWD
jgi:hypothetical protein